MDEEEQRQQAIQANYKMGKYGTKYCSHCGASIEYYKYINSGLCFECLSEIDNY